MYLYNNTGHDGNNIRNKPFIGLKLSVVMEKYNTLNVDSVVFCKFSTHKQSEEYGRNATYKIYIDTQYCTTTQKYLTKKINRNFELELKIKVCFRFFSTFLSCKEPEWTSGLP